MVYLQTRSDVQERYRPTKPSSQVHTMDYY